jgi:enoyl-CoA hydratase/carnithine racemase
VSDEEVQCRTAEGVAVVTLNRPDQLNAFTDAMGARFDALMVDLAGDDDVRAIVLTGAGRGFCAGLDMADLAVTSKSGRAGEPPPDQPRPAYDALDAPPELRSRYLLPMAIGKPVIGAINGTAAGLGLSLALACDVRFAADSATFTAIFGRRGLTAELGIAWTLPALVGQSVASDLLLSGRKVPALEAGELGLVNAVVPATELLPAATAYAADIAAQVSPRSARIIKAQLYQARQQTLMEAMSLAWREAGRSLRSADCREGIAHFVERRPPHFTGD